MLQNCNVLIHKKITNRPLVNGLFMMNRMSYVKSSGNSFKFDKRLRYLLLIDNVPVLEVHRFLLR